MVAGWGEGGGAELVHYQYKECFFSINAQIWEKNSSAIFSQKILFFFHSGLEIINQWVHYSLEKYIEEKYIEENTKENKTMVSEFKLHYWV